MASELLQSISQDADEIARFRTRRKFQMDWNHSMIVSGKEGREEGREEERKLLAKKR